MALITRAHLEMDLRLEHAGKALSNFLEDDLSGSYLGLSQDARVHLERFRSFLHSFYVQKYGYWPPPQPKRNCKILPKSTYQTMYSEIRNLYEYLVDPRSSDSFENNRQAYVFSKTSKLSTTDTNSLAYPIRYPCCPRYHMTWQALKRMGLPSYSPANKPGWIVVLLVLLHSSELPMPAA